MGAWDRGRRPTRRQAERHDRSLAGVRPKGPSVAGRGAADGSNRRVRDEVVRRCVA